LHCNIQPTKYFFFMTYLPTKPVRTSQVRRGDLSLRINEWGNWGAPKLFLCHGWMDTGLSWQFVADALSNDWHVIAPDWRGFGGSGRPEGGYWFADYYADFEAILNHFSPDQAASVVGHSMGGKIISQYAGLRPDRIAQLINIEGFGMPSLEPKQIISRYGKWLDSLQTPSQLRDYDDFDALAAKLAKGNPKLAPDRAAFIARCWGEEVDINGSTRIRLRADPRHKSPNPVPYHREDALHIWQNTTAKTLWVSAEGTMFSKFLFGLREAGEEYRPDKEILLSGSGHMLHLEQPEQVARLIEDFFA
jgi:pimeloyl-ACP methyl ester carboxylesterase